MPDPFVTPDSTANCKFPSDPLLDCKDRLSIPEGEREKPAAPATGRKRPIRHKLDSLQTLGWRSRHLTGLLQNPDPLGQIPEMGAQVPAGPTAWTRTGSSLVW